MIVERIGQAFRVEAVDRVGIADALAPGLGPRAGGVPPCIRQRPFAMAGDRQGIPMRVRQAALQRGAALGSPRGLPLRSGPVRSFIICSYAKPPA
jgi:hypothetical protein